MAYSEFPNPAPGGHGQETGHSPEILRSYTKMGLRDFVGYGQPLWLPHTEQAQGQPVQLVSTP